MSKKAKKISTHVVIALGASLVLGGIFTVLSMQSFSKVKVIVAARDIEPYSQALVAEDFKVIEIARGDVGNFSEFVNKSEELIGKVPTTAIFSGQPVKSIQFVNPDDAKGLQSIVTNEGNRGLYLPMTATNALLGDMKIGGEYDFYIAAEQPKPVEGNPANTETVIVPLQASYMVNKLITSEDGNVSVFIEFPEEESERYVMLKTLLTNNKAQLIATMPNAIHEQYQANRLEYADFFGGLIKDKNFFTSVNEKFLEKTDVTIENEDVSNEKEDSKEDTVSTETKE